MLEQNVLKQDYSKFELYKSQKAVDKVYQKGWYDKILLKAKTPIKNYDED